MNASEVAEVLLYGVDPSWSPASREVVSEPLAEVVDLRGVPRARLVVDSQGRKRLEYDKDSLWAFPPVDLGPIRSNRLDEFLYKRGPGEKDS